MSVVKSIKASLSGGFYSRAIYARVDIQKYGSGLKTCRNFIVHSAGGVANRPGTMYRADCGVDTLSSRVVPFVFSSTQSYILEFGHEFIRFFTPDGQIANSGVAYQIDSPYDSLSISSLNFESSADVIYITHPDYEPRTLSRLGNANWLLETYSPTDGPFQTENLLLDNSLSVAATTGSTTLSIASYDDPYTILLLHCDGSDASTTVTDSSQYAHTVTCVDNAQLDTADFKFGTASILFDGASDEATIPDHASFEFGADPFSIDLWIKPNGLPGSTSSIVYHGVASNFYRIYLNSSGNVGFSAENGGVVIAGYLSTNGSITGTGWQHIEVTRSGTNFYIFVDGVSQDVSVNTAVGTTAFPDYTSTFKLSLSSNDYDGWMDEIRVSKGIARHIEDFTPETTAYSNMLTSYTFDPDQVGALFKLRHYIEGQAITSALSSATTTSSIKCFTTWRLITHGNWTGTLRVERSVDGGTTWTNLREFSSASDFNANTSGTEDVEINTVPFLVRINMTSYSSGTANVNLTTDAFYQEGIMKSTGYIDETSMTVSISSDVGSTDATLLWAEGSWSNYRGWPTVARFFQDRLVFASTAYEPMSLWMTIIGNYTSFYRHQTLLDTDAITTRLPSRQVNAINGLVALTRLIAFTSSSEWSIDAGSSGALTPSSITQKVQGYRGSFGVNPVTVGNEIMYVQKIGKVVRTLGYEFSSDSFNGSELNVLSRDLFDDYTITEMAYQQDPDSIIWCLRDNGDLLGCTYLKEQEVVAWHHHDTDGDIVSIATIPTTGYDQLWMVVNRDGTYVIESMVQRMASTAREDQFFVDCGLTYDSASTSTITGLDHLEGKYVSILADGTVLDSQVVSSGTISLASSASVVHVGLPYQSDLETLNLDFSDRGQTLQGKKVQMGEAIFRMINSLGGNIGTTSNNIYEFFREADIETYSGEALDDSLLYTGDLRAPLGSGYEQGGRVFYRQSDPLPVEITAIITEVAIGDSTG